MDEEPFSKMNCIQLAQLTVILRYVFIVAFTCMHKLEVFKDAGNVRSEAGIVIFPVTFLHECVILLVAACVGI